MSSDRRVTAREFLQQDRRQQLRPVIGRPPGSSSHASYGLTRSERIEKPTTGSNGETPPHDEKSSSAPSTVKTHKLRLQPTLLNGLAIVHGDQSVEIPHIAGVILSTLLGSGETSPVCILLPSTEAIPQFTAIFAALECLASDFPAARDEFIARQLKPGTRVRALPEGNTYIVGKRHAEYGIDGVFMYYTEKETFESNGRRLVPVDQLIRYEPTTRKLPISRASTKLSKPWPSTVDELAGTRAFGNTTLYTTRVILIGSRADFERNLDQISLRRKMAVNGHPVPPLAYSFAWGTFDDGGHPSVLHPSGSGGCPLVAIVRDLIELEVPCLGKTSTAGSQLVITDRLDLVARSLDLANRIGERQRLLLLADARRRSDIEPLRAQGWRIWEPRPWELLPHSRENIKPIITGLPGLDQCQISAHAERNPSVDYLEKECPHLSAAHRGLSDLGGLLSSEAASYDERMQESLETINRIFFQCAGWLSQPSEERLGACASALQRVKANQDYINRYLGTAAGMSLESFTSGIELFLCRCREGETTPKGQGILDTLQGTSAQRLVTGSRQSLEEANAFLVSKGLDTCCSLATEVANKDEFSNSIAFSIMRRDMFDRFVDPWPSQHILFVGYRFEVDIYKKRLAWRERQKARLGLDEASRTAVTSMPADRFAKTGNEPVVRPPPSFVDDDLAGFDAVTSFGHWNWQKRISIPNVPPEETSHPATLS